MRLILLTLTCLFAATLSACHLVYELPIVQGNVLEKTESAQLKTGMTPEQVEFLMGTALLKNRTEDTVRWDYVSYFLGARGQERRNTVSVYFQDGRVSWIDGLESDSGVEQQQAESIEDAKELAAQREAQARGDALDAEDAAVREELRDQDGVDNSATPNAP